MDFLQIWASLPTWWAAYAKKFATQSDTSEGYFTLETRASLQGKNGALDPAPLSLPLHQSGWISDTTRRNMFDRPGENLEEI